MRDMANPGTAYDDPVLGKDRQPGHLKDYVQTESDNGGVHINSGIPNRAFVLAAKAIGGRSWEVTGKTWYVTLTERLNSSGDFEKCARETLSVARDLFPNDPQSPRASRRPGWMSEFSTRTTEWWLAWRGPRRGAAIMAAAPTKTSKKAGFRIGEKRVAIREEKPLPRAERPQ